MKKEFLSTNAPFFSSHPVTPLKAKKSILHLFILSLNRLAVIQWRGLLLYKESIAYPQSSVTVV
ncbi:MAG: hypothetical protein ACQEUT_08215 [Bacillota bacterium]